MGKMVSECQTIRAFAVVWDKGGTLATCKAPIVSPSSYHYSNTWTFTDRMPFLPSNQQCQSTEGWRCQSANSDNVYVHALVCVCYITFHICSLVTTIITTAPICCTGPTSKSQFWPAASSFSHLLQFHADEDQHVLMLIAGFLEKLDKPLPECQAILNYATARDGTGLKALLNCKWK